MSGENQGSLGHTNAAFAIAGSITIFFNTALACLKDAYKPLNSLMNAIAWHNWITQGLADVVLFLGLGMILTKTSWVKPMAPGRLISFLVGTVIVAGVGLFVWFALY
jgi:predicted tellurium resistance membrane protein TerC